MLQIDKTIRKPYYVQIYEYYRHEIEERRMVAGMRLSSVRELAQSVNVSKMTVEKAYYQLASEGYILRRNKARYEVASLGSPDDAPGAAAVRENHGLRHPAWLYDFGSGDMDMEHFPLDIWRKYMNRVLSEPDYLLACHDEQGVPDLRQILSQYVYQTRGVHARPDNIIIGAGTVSLLSTLTNLLHEECGRIGVENPGFRLGREIFRSAGYEIVPISIAQGMLNMTALEKSGVRLVYVSPSHQFPTGTVMPAGMRYRLLQWAGERDGLIIEDDYDSELRYYGRPVPALQGLDTHGRVIYMGALSKVLPFFVRLSYMVLPDRIMTLYNRRRALFRQSASVPEQCVLASYIQSGELARQIRRLRKEYQEKGAQMRQLLQAAFGSDITISPMVSGVYCHVTLRSPWSEQELRSRAEQHGCRVLSMQSFYEIPKQEDSREFLLSFSKIPGHQLKQAVAALQAAWTEKEGY
ncbi:GntR family transcriptional regulator [Megasphaera cerevisiae DSM 20462]|uniref:GntR family transcriptional regulator n=1 Tax=Megasphaera cerevisiae DSM 20462 TaxID=1122219 RepID=A0A0J6ZRE3_9FIRM|nr:PLP-dependent aminotransferase family protein [Megasphaera cerevisiae]KMO87511.1 GntR family transcriptional regulator [Megasphaera cerevisiae DSM 20462]SJZ52042.1 transcriptional regulator, GntR family [Megasphaera cerevisiae DSM 20462]